ncbi:polyketide synthase, partial [Streptomyces sp. SID14478]|uniref:polyketide synthase n=1 Tax=Streptomyces sp. SID14478 TaxID=2706073 RepID=UPI0031BA60F0
MPPSSVWKYPTPAAKPDPGHEREAEPVAIVGMGCRLPGGIDTPEALWQALLDGAGTDGLLDDVAGFDADLFRIPAAEARHLDPGQRIALETAWAALDDARIVHDDLVHGRTGVFMGTRAQAVPDRIARTLAVATACASSLTAARLAVRSLREGEVDLALVGGVHLLLSPHITRHVRGEGSGALVLRRLSDALAAGDRVYAVIRDVAVTDGGADPGHDSCVRTRVGEDGAAGVMGLMKSALALHHGELPAGLPGPAERTPWPGGARRAGVSGP